MKGLLMNYSSIYNRLIDKSKHRVILESEYYEKHHIIPKCLNGSDEKDNLVYLTAREHYIAHLLLCKIYPSNPKLILALMMMCVDNNSRNKRTNNRLYEWMRKEFSKNHPSRTNIGKEKIKQGLMAYFNSIEWECKKKLIKEKKYEVRSCLCGCGQTFEVYKKSKKKYLNRKHQVVPKHSDEQKTKISDGLKKTISTLSDNEKADRISKSLGQTDHIKRGQHISQSKKGKSTNQQEIMGRKYASMDDYEFYLFINTKSPRTHKRIILLREKWKNLK